MIAVTIAILLVFIFILKSNFKFVYKVKVGDRFVGYVSDKDEFTCTVTNQVLNPTNEDIKLVVLNEIPTYSLAVVGKDKKTDEKSIISLLKLKSDITYRLYAVTLEGEDRAYVDTLEEAQNKVAELTASYGESLDSEFGIREVYTDNKFEYKDMKYATINKLTKHIEEEITEKEEEERLEAEKNGKNINGVIMTNTPVIGRVSSRYGVNESIRDHTHKGIDIAAANGTNIVAAADGEVKYAQFNNGGYGYLVIISHGNGVETYYAHCSKLYVTQGQHVNAGELIAAVGSTGYSTGNHLHFEIRQNGEQINPEMLFF